MKIQITRLILTAGLATAPVAVQANVLTWANAAGGSASLAANWSPNQSPAPTDDLTFNLAGSFPVTFNAAVPSSRTHIYRQGTVTLTASAPHTVTDGITMGTGAGDNATMTLASGTLTSNLPSTVGVVSGATGVLNVNSSVADLIMNDNFFVGGAGTGTLNVTALGHVRVAQGLLVGNNPTGVGAVTVSGALVTAPFGNSFLEVLGASDSGIGQLGDGSLVVSNGALASFAGSLSVGVLSGSNSSVTLQTAGLFDARLVVASNLSLGRNTAVATPAGTGQITVNSGGSATVGGTVFVGGDPDGGTGTLRINAGGEVVAHDVIAGAGGDIQHVGGTLVIDGGSLVNDTPPITISNTPANNPVLRLINGGSADAVATTNPGRALTIGGTAGASTGTLDVLSGGDMRVFASLSLGIVDAAIADGSDDTGVVTVDGAGSTFQCTNDNSTLAIGLNGNANAAVSAGGLISFGTVNIGAEATSTSVATVDGAGSKLEARVQLNVGGDASGVGGTATLTAGNGGRIDVPTSAANAVRIWQSGEIILNTGGSLTTTGTIDVRTGGLLTVNGGSVTSGSVLVAGSAGIVGNGSVTGSISAQGGSQITANGTLSLGKISSATGFSMQPTANLSVGSFDVTLEDSNAADVGTATIAGGTLNAANSFALASGASLTGFGLVNSSVGLNGGAISATGSGLRFNGFVTRSSGTIGGTTIGFNSGGGFNGAGTINAIVDFDAGSTCTNTGILTMGSAASNFGCTLDGTLHVGSGTVTLLDANGIGLGTLTDLDNGDLVCAQNLTVNAGRTIEGTGFVQTPLLTLNGAVKPADLPSVPPRRGTLNVSGAVTMGANNNYFCDIDPGIEFATADRIQSSGAATISGALTVAFIDGYVPQANQIFDIVVGSSRTGVFSSTSFPPVGSFGPPHVEYTADRARIIMCYVNCDGSVVAPTLTANDFQCFLNRFASQDPYANCDGSTAIPVLTANDFQCFLNKFASGCN